MATVRGMIGRPVVQRGTGKHLGHVRDIVLNREGTRVLALQLSTASWLNPARGIAWGQVRATGPTRVEADGEAAELAAIAADGVALSDLSARSRESVLTTGGGALDDAVFDPATGHVVGYQVSSGFLQDLLEGRRFLALDGTPSGDLAGDGAASGDPAGDGSASGAPAGNDVDSEV